MRYALGLGVPKDDVQAVLWYTKAAEQGVETAQSSLAKMYEDGKGVAADPALALYWYRKAAEQGDTAAQATTALDNAGLTVGPVYGPPNGLVFDTVPTAGTAEPVGTAITLYTN